MNAYRLYFLDGTGRIQARQDFLGDSDAQAMAIGEALWQACADCYPDYELWQDSRCLVGEGDERDPAAMPAPARADDPEVQGRVLELEELLLASHWRVARSERLLASAEALRGALGRDAEAVTHRDIVRYICAATGTEMMSLQLVEGTSLKLCGSFGFDRLFDAYFATVDDGDCACGAAFRDARQTIVTAIDASPIFAGQESLEVLRSAGVASCVSTPLPRADGGIAGMVSLHRRGLWHPEAGELARLSALAGEIGAALADPRSSAARLIRQPARPELGSPRPPLD